MIKTIPLAANTEVSIDLVGGTHVNIENRGSGTVYVSKNANVVANSDEVMAIDSGTSKAMRNVATYSIRENVANYYGTIYVVSDSDTAIEVTTANDLNFKQVGKGGDDEIVSSLQNTIDSLTIQKLKTAEDSYSASYQLYKNKVAIGDKINIPKDLVVESGSVKTVESENTPVEGYVVGDKYIDLVLANSNDGHIYILVSDLVEGVGEYYFINGIKKGEIFNDYSHNIASGENSHSEGDNTTASGDCSHAEGNYNDASGSNSHVEGASNKATNACSHAEGYMVIASGDYSHAQGFSTTAEGTSSHAEGGGTKSIGAYSHAEGGGTKSIGANSHAEGLNTIANGENSHAEGTYTTANGANSHAGGFGTVSNGANSHTEGTGTITSISNQVAIGTYNVEDSQSVLIIGNGTSNGNRNNLLTLSWNGSLVVDNIKNQLSDTLVEGLKYQLGILTSDITLTLPETATSDIEVDFAIADTTYAITCDYLSLDVVANTYYQIVFSYDKALNTWFASVISSDYISTTTAEVLTDETT